MALQIGSILLTMVSWDFRGLSIVLFLRLFIGFSLCVCVSVYVWMHEDRNTQKPLVSDSPWAEVIGTFEVPNTDAEKWTQVFDKSSMQYTCCTLATFPAHTPENLSPFLIAFPLPKGFEHKCFLSFLYTPSTCRVFLKVAHSARDTQIIFSSLYFLAWLVFYLLRESSQDPQS